ncbi:carboxylesterase/lipase family protein [Microbulbifer sp.]|uniref:carboxylesterase/lipase family protein n=1 Tax=Microbulbifer sp. TaxID=1908541 RepID=UPI003F386A9D
MQHPQRTKLLHQLALLATCWLTIPLALPDSLVHTRFGDLRGEAVNGVERFLGIPYAAPPVGDLRWRAPRDPQPWRGVLQARAFGSACAQYGNYFTSNDSGSFGKIYGSEDCLYLNVWTPSHSGTPGEKRPVLVFIHGGSGTAGAASLPVYEASRLSRELNSVVVSVNYRLGIFGVIHLPALHTGDPREDSGSFFLLDQIKALEWVQRNIEVFGGDPRNVTAMGHSAGGVSTWSMLRSPLAKGKFRRAVVLSGIPMSAPDSALAERSETFLRNLLRADSPLKNEEQFAQLVADKGPASIRDYLYAKSTAELLAAARGLPAKSGAGHGVVLAENEDPRREFVNAVPLLMSNVADEASMRVAKKYLKPNTRVFWRYLSGGAPLQTADLFDTWPYAIYRGKTLLTNFYLRKKVADSANRLSQTGVPVYRYVFAWKDIPEPWRKLFGAFHGLDVPFIFGNFDGDSPNYLKFAWTRQNAEEREAIHYQLVTALKGFIETGDPNRYSGDLHWPRWNQDGDLTLVR